MPVFKTTTEMGALREFIQYLEQLISGSLTAGSGINRSLERLSGNADALLEAVQTAKFCTLRGGGTISYNAGSLAFTNLLYIDMLNEVGGAEYNEIDPVLSPIILPVDGALAYVALDRDTNAASLAVNVENSMADLLVTMSTLEDRLDYLILCIRDASGVRFFDGRHLQDGEDLSNDGYTDTQYAQQTEATLIRENQKENLKFIITGGGTLSWDTGTSTFTWSADLVVQYGSSAGNNTVLAGSQVVNVGEGIYITLIRDPVGVINLAFVAASMAGFIPDLDNTFLFAVHHTDGRLYLWNGQSFSDGESALLGGVRSGVEWYYFANGGAVQPIDLTEGGVYPERAYFVGTRELMIYRNGLKARGSTAYWNGIFPAGALVGALDTNDEYVEEDIGDGTGNRLLWLRDNTPDALGHLSNTHDPVWTWPDADDLIEGFVGVNGRPPTLYIPAGIYGFEEVIGRTATGVQIAGGYLSTGTAIYRNTTAPAIVGDPAVDTVGAAPIPSDWNYVYVGAGAVPGADPVLAFSSEAPLDWGVHPADPEYYLLSSVLLDAGGAVLPFTKSGTWVTLMTPVDVLAALVPLVGVGLIPVSLAGFLPETWPTVVRIRMRVGAVLAGVLGEFQYQGLGGTVPQLLHAVVALDPVFGPCAEFIFEVALDATQDFEGFLDGAVFAMVLDAHIIGYAEGRFSSGVTLGV